MDCKIQRSNEMQVSPVVVAPSLKALLENFIDYAGVYPPATLSLDKALANYGIYQSGDYSWMLRWFVIGAGELEKVPQPLDGKLSVIAEKDEQRAASIESRASVNAQRPVYWEVATTNLSELDAVKACGNFAKIRTGGVKPEAIPSPAEVAAFILACADRRLAFKATAGLHHPIRAEHPLTYEPDAPRAIMHGFLNVLMASALAWHGERDIEPVIADTDPDAFSFDEFAHWKGRSLTVEQIRNARRDFIHSVGSCSFDEPVQELRALGLI